MQIAPQCSRKDGGCPLPTSLLSSCSPESKDRLGRLGHLKARAARPSWRVYIVRAEGWTESWNSVRGFEGRGKRSLPWWNFQKSDSPQSPACLSQLAPHLADSIPEFWHVPRILSAHPPPISKTQLWQHPSLITPISWGKKRRKSGGKVRLHRSEKSKGDPILPGPRDQSFHTPPAPPFLFFNLL